MSSTERRRKSTMGKTTVMRAASPFFFPFDDVAVGADEFLGGGGDGKGEVVELEVRDIVIAGSIAIGAHAVIHVRAGIEQALSGIGSPFVGGGDDDAGGETLVSKCGEVGIQIRCGERVDGEMEFALDAAELAGGAFLCHDVDAGVAACSRPFAVE
jgi:hypothetical protein